MQKNEVQKGLNRPYKTYTTGFVGFVGRGMGVSFQILYEVFERGRP